MWAHQVVVKVFVKPEESLESVERALAELIPLEGEEFKIETERVMGFGERVIHILRVRLTKQRAVNVFLKWFVSSLAPAQKSLLIEQAGSRVDDQLNLFVRLDKGGWLKHRKVWLTESGECFHVRISLAVFPRKRELALDLVHELFQKNF